MSLFSRQLRSDADANEVSMLIAGTGGLGVVGLTKLMADCFGARFQCVHTEETRGIAQRRAPVCSIVRAGRSIRSARLPDGLVDVMLAVEAAEALRAASHIRAGTLCILADLIIPASGAMSAAISGITVTRVVEALQARGAQVMVVPVAGWLHRERLPEMLSSIAVFGAAAQLFGYSLEQAEAHLARQFGSRMWMQNREALHIGYVVAPGTGQRVNVPPVVHRPREISFDLVAV